MSSSLRIKGQRRYGPIWARLKETFYCRVECPSTEDTITVINGVKKEKSQDRQKPKDKVLDIKTSDGMDKQGERCTVIEFRLVIDTSINNL